MTLLWGVARIAVAALNIRVQHKRSTHINPVFHLDDNTRPVAMAIATVPAANANKSERESATELLRR